MKLGLYKKGAKMDRCDLDAEYQMNPRRVSFNFWVEEARYMGTISGDALDKLAGGDAGLEAGCLKSYSTNWVQIHGVAALKFAAGLPPRILSQDV
ncbi:hypothetical protein [Delftia acidovorans]|uniref:hypothetical protein n=1 Tax=Delftia acidovorans TaxID=80866 RepID=UPI0018E7070D|nr:hypothetical protein [Delftia acidovorans]